jgi:two-component system, chemotaxis family, chemotaxis protein CheY
MEDTILAPLRILIVDDSAQMRDLLQGLLEAIGISDILVAKDGEEGHALFLQTAPDIIITDGTMSPLDGYGLTDRIRSDANNPNPFVPIIMISGHLEDINVQRARNSGVSEYLAKPISSKTLYERLIAIVSNPYYFIQTPTYLGPDRRRSDGDVYKGDDRRISALAVPNDDKVVPIKKSGPFEFIKSFT